MHTLVYTPFHTNIGFHCPQHVCTTCSTAGLDYTAATGDLQFSATALKNCVDISLADDDIAEEEEVFEVELTTSDPRVSLDPVKMDVTITDTSSESLPHTTNHSTHSC